jgi:hypothetical protein
MIRARCVVGVTARRFHHCVGRSVAAVSASSPSTTSLVTFSNDARGRVHRFGTVQPWPCLYRQSRANSHINTRDDTATGPVVATTTTTTTASPTTLDPAASSADDTAPSTRDDDDDIDVPLHRIEVFERAGGRVEWSTVIDEKTGQSRPYYHLHSVAGDAADQIIVEWACALDDPAEKEA